MGIKFFACNRFSLLRASWFVFCTFPFCRRGTEVVFVKSWHLLLCALDSLHTYCWLIEGVGHAGLFHFAHFQSESSLFVAFSVLRIYCVMVCLRIGECSSADPLLDAVLSCFAWQSPILPLLYLFNQAMEEGSREEDVDESCVESCKVHLHAFIKVK